MQTTINTLLTDFIATGFTNKYQLLYKNHVDGALWAFVVSKKYSDNAKQNGFCCHCEWGVGHTWTPLFFLLFLSLYFMTFWQICTIESQVGDIDISGKTPQKMSVVHIAGERMGGGPVGLTSWQSSRELTSWAFWQERMEPARLSITHTADSSMKNVICDREGEKGQHGVKKTPVQRTHL